jgi:hypothetical protein
MHQAPHTRRIMYLDLYSIAFITFSTIFFTVLIKMKVYFLDTSQSFILLYLGPLAQPINRCDIGYRYNIKY